VHLDSDSVRVEKGKSGCAMTSECGGDIYAAWSRRRRFITSSRDGGAISNRRSVAIQEIRPTQVTVGYREVAEKRLRWREAPIGGKESLLRRLVVPVVLGPGANCYAVDRHHWICALLLEGISDVPITVADDLQCLDQAMFWSELDRRGWCRPYDAQRRRQEYCEIPSSMSGLKDDPFRSLASALRHAGGYTKDEALFSEFVWADFLRDCMLAEEVEADFDSALKAALVLSRRVAAGDLRLAATGAEVAPSVLCGVDRIGGAPVVTLQALTPENFCNQASSSHE
jgi:hypothetical protein